MAERPFFDHGALASRRYQVRPYAGRTMVVLPDNNPDGVDAWKPLLSGPHEFVDMACEHRSLLRDPHAAGLAEVITAALGPVRP
jgi:thioesterase domain-containing protein